MNAGADHAAALAQRAQGQRYERTGRRATVRRDGEVRELPAAELVAGDVCLLQIGDDVPADLRLLEVSELTVGDGSLTGKRQTEFGYDTIRAPLPAI